MISVSTTKSSTNWLDRLRSSRGFPTGGEPDLDRFLSTSSSSGSVPTTGSTHSESTQCRQDPIPKRKYHRNDDQVSTVLCDLFYMGEAETSRSFSKMKKSSRKQANPRFCGVTTTTTAAVQNGNELCSSDDLRREKSENGLASSGDNSLNNNTRKENTNNDDSNNKSNNVEEREEGDFIDMKEYSRSEVMVIDTSLLPEWKFDGWVFRKDDDWKIKEKKSKSRVFGAKKKRKLLVNNLNGEKLLDQDAGKEKKRKKLKINNKDEDNFMPPSKGQSQNDKKEQPLKQAPDFLGKVPQKRFPCPRPPEKLGNGGSSVILLKSIPLNDSNNEGAITKLGKNPLKKHRKQMKIV